MAEISFNRDPPPGFQGLRDDLPITMYQRRLPHWRQIGATYFVTFRLADSLPQGKLHELKSIKREWLRRHPPPRSKGDWETLSRNLLQRAEHWLDQGMGECCLKRSACAEIVVDSLRQFDNDRYELGCFVVMPNHVHLIIRPLSEDVQALEKILQNLKGYTARRINQELKLSGTLWQEESFDRIIRDAEHLWKCIQYIGRNPRFANLTTADVPCWVRDNWRVLGWGFEDV